MRGRRTRGDLGKANERKLKGELRSERGGEEQKEEGEETHFDKVERDEVQSSQTMQDPSNLPRCPSSTLRSSG